MIGVACRNLQDGEFNSRWAFELGARYLKW